MTRQRHDVLARVTSALRTVIVDEGMAASSPVMPQSRLVDDLGFDSVRIASLTIALEEQFDEILLLGEWIADASSPSDLTVDSLVEYLLGVLEEGT
ncbi:MAG TPA: acyl carrier protein [Candidatus Binatia bacterium]|nr:acyl carrier protein [Candidatus Binatia bacterium]